MKKPIDPKPSNPWPLLIALMLLSLAAYTTYSICTRPRPQALSQCVKCGHLFAPGTGKDVPLIDAGGRTNRLIAYCSTDAPKYDLIRSALSLGDNVELKEYWSYYVRAAEHQVREDGSDINPPMRELCFIEVTNYITITTTQLCTRPHFERIDWIFTNDTFYPDPH